MRPKLIRIDLEQSSEGLLYATSRDLPGLLVAGKDRESVDQEIPLVIEKMFEAQGIAVEVQMAELIDGAPTPPWIALPLQSKNGAAH